ncbi:head GIN domain-containing protein [Aequorivita echinoideorum]|uniref:DUF2807 domain-containing protein n=1 Tax=Aequorivita echinoideorum TaxID=1549647 RepID=A0ABS5S593_9FLAO|nr:head GIN domain-containing protein [Aequorivita echinoideorum]MBT0608387.1 DUF2807 domain-containing protein [Aequorivita echinoideorum]
MKTIFKISAIAATFLFISCNFNVSFGEDGNGNVVTEERTVSENFTEIRGSEGLNVEITQGDENKITVEADENLLQYIETEVESGKLKIGTSENIGRATAKNVYVTFKQVNTLEASSGAELISKNVVKSENLSLNSSSGANLDVEIFAKKSTAKSSSGSQLLLRGKSSALVADASSGSKLDAKQLLVIDCDAEASSGATVTVNVKERLETRASSGGEINYYGNPSAVNSDKSRSGSVNKM